MKRRFLLRTTAFVLLLLWLSVLSGCGGTKLSGTYVSEHDSSEYFVFSGESKVSYYGGERHLDGAYHIEEDVAIAVFDTESEEDALQVFRIKDDRTIFVGLIAFVKKNALVEFLKEIWHKYWLQILIGLIVIGAISSAIEKIGDHIHKK